MIQIIDSILNTNKKISLIFVSLLIFSGCSSGGGGGSSPTVTNYAPVITSANSISVNENQTSAVTITATDTSAITYSIAGTDASSFDINDTNGIVTFKVAPDYEIKNSYIFTATASDGSLSDSMDVTISIIDINLYIKSAVYDNNRTLTTEDDILYIYFNKSIDENSIAVDTGSNYEVNGTGAIGSASGSDYNDTVFHRHMISQDDGSSGSLEISTNNDTNISLAINTITDTNSLYPDNYTQTTVEKFNVFARLKTGQVTSYDFNDDGEYQKGISRSYTNSGDTVTDNASGLIWQKEDDNITRSWSDSQSYCAGITLDSNSDFRLPTIRELVSISDKGRKDPSIDPIFTNTDKGLYWSSTIFALNPTLDAWTVNFAGGGDAHKDKEFSYYVRCVR